MESFAPYLDVAVRASRAAGDLLRADLHRLSGPRGEGEKAPADTEAEQIIRGILLGAESDWGFLGEETGRVPGAPGAPIWVVDPNDGTRDYIKGRRGSSVSIALVWKRRPVLGVVHPFAYPDDNGAIYTAAVGQEGVFKNGAPVSARLPERLSGLDVVLVSGGGDRAARANLLCTRPARVMSMPSIAHRLAKVAAGEASATTSLYAPMTWDYAAGHCLILAAGGVVLDQNGNEPAYDDDANGSSPRLFAGSRAVATALSSRNWDLAFGSERETSMPIVRLPKGGAVSDSGLLSRAQGALLGHLVGSAFGVSSPADGSNNGLQALSGGGAAGQGQGGMAGQIGATGELAIAVARSLLDLASDARSLRRVYTSWAATSSPGSDHAIEAALKGQAGTSGPSASALARVTPLTVWAHEANPVILETLVRTDTAITHAGPTAGDAAAALAITLQALLHGALPSAAVETAHSFARRSGFCREVIEAIVESHQPPFNRAGASASMTAMGVLRTALFQVVRARSFQEALEGALKEARVTDALTAIVGALAGARFGREGVPRSLRYLVLSCRPLEGVGTIPRPSNYWATDAMPMAEALLTAR